MFEQLVITVCGIASIWLSQSPAFAARRWAPVIGLAAQPAWVVASWRAEQWGILLLSLVYAAGWARGIHTYWVRRPA